MYTLIGSKAINFHLPNFRSNAKDTDLICTKEEMKFLIKLCMQKGYSLLELKYVSSDKAYFKMYKGHDLYIIEINLIGDNVIGQHVESNTQLSKFRYPVTVAVLLDIVPGVSIAVNVPNLNNLYSMKMSHRYKRNSVHFNKTMQDIRALRQAGCCIHDETWYTLRCNETYNYSHPSLNQTKSTFFTDNVDYKYDHDSLHEAVKLQDKPAYTYYICEGAEVQCSKEKFFATTEDIRINGVLEESYVLALERSVIPFGTDPEKAFNIALEKVCTSITSGWFREYAWENYEKIKSMYSVDYLYKYMLALQTGKLKPFKNDVDTK